MSLFLSLFLACSSSSSPTVLIDGTTARIDEAHTYNKDAKNDLNMVIMTTEKECERFLRKQKDFDSKEKRKSKQYADELEKCLPWFDRGTGEVKLAVRFEEQKNDTYPMSLDENGKNLEIGQNGNVLALHVDGVEQKVRPHIESRGKQLFVLMIDASGSMRLGLDGEEIGRGDSRPSRMDVVKEALNSKALKEAFFPNNTDTRVVFYTFTKDVRPLGGSVKALKDGGSEYQNMVENLSSRDGYTHLYQAIDHGLTKLPKDPEIKSLIKKGYHPTLVVLTDGFNNLSPQDNELGRQDNCSDNVSRLQPLLNKIQALKTTTGADKGGMEIVTIGFGKALKPRFDAAEWREEFERKTRGSANRGAPKVTADHLCPTYKGKTQKNARIDSSGEYKGLEKYIDNISLAMIAEVGNGQTSVRKDAKGLEDAFKGAIAKRYQWFEFYYRTDVKHLRKKVEVNYKLRSFKTSESFITIYPHAWLDGPSGKPDKDGFPERASVWHSTTILSSGMGLFLFLSILGAAVFNVKRIISGRLKRTK